MREDVTKPGVEHWEIKLSLLSTNLLDARQILIAMMLWNLNKCEPGILTGTTYQKLAKEINESVANVIADIARLEWIGLLRVINDAKGLRFTLFDPNEVQKGDVRFVGGPCDNQLMRLPNDWSEWQPEIRLRLKESDVAQLQNEIRNPAELVDHTSVDSNLVAVYALELPLRYKFVRLEPSESAGSAVDEYDLRSRLRIFE